MITLVKISVSVTVDVGRVVGVVGVVVEVVVVMVVDSDVVVVNKSVTG